MTVSVSVPEVDVLSFAAERDSATRPFLVDVREPNEYAKGHIDGSVHIPLGQIPTRFDEIPKDRPVVVQCRLGGRSAKAVEYLQSQGYTNVRNLTGGIQAWAREIDPSIAHD